MSNRSLPDSHFGISLTTVEVQLPTAYLSNFVVQAVAKGAPQEEITI